MKAEVQKSVECVEREALEALGFACLDSRAFKETSDQWLDYNINNNN